MPAHSKERESLSVETHLDCISGVIHGLCCRKRLGTDNEEELRSYVLLRLLENDEAILRRFEGRSSTRTYLTVVVERLYLDWQTARWGRFRPTAAARRLGPDAMALERMVVRDGWTLGEAVEQLAHDPRCRATRDDLERFSGILHFRPRTYVAGEAALPVGAASGDDAGARLDAQHHDVVASTVARTLDAALGGFDAEDRLLLRLHYGEGFSLRRVADRLGAEPRRLYRRAAGLRTELRQRLVAAGVGWPDIRNLIGSSETRLRVDALNGRRTHARSGTHARLEDRDEDDETAALACAGRIKMRC